MLLITISSVSLSLEDALLWNIGDKEVLLDSSGQHAIVAVVNMLSNDVYSSRGSAVELGIGSV